MTVGADVRITATRLDSPVAQGLITELLADLTERYGGPDPVRTDPDDFWPPRGMFVVAELEGTPVGCAGLRDLDTEVGELKRMYVRPAARGRGVARAVLGELERRALDAGVRRLRLLTGEAQPEAVQLYRSAGWTPGEMYGPAIEHGWTQALAFERHLGEHSLP